MSSIIILMSISALVLCLTKDILHSLALLVMAMIFLDFGVIIIHYILQIPNKIIMLGIMGGTMSKILIFLLCQKYLKIK